VYVATSDAIEQVIIYGAGAYRLSARGLLEQILAAKERMRQEYQTD
jgi:predicted RNA-binding protein with PIN domain